MDQRQIDKFFSVLNQNIKDKIKGKVKIILTGAAAGALMGGSRPSVDIDFAVDCGKGYFKEFEEAIKLASGITGIAANFSEDIDRWSQITFLDYRNHTRLYKAFGAIEVVILSGDYWSIGKITRYLDSDVDDLVKVLKSNKVPAPALARLWGRALSKSPRSTASFIFKKHVEHFFKTYGISIWGKDFGHNKCLSAFYKASGIKDYA